MQTMSSKARPLVAKVHQRTNTKKNISLLPPAFKEGDWVLDDHSRLPACTGDRNQDSFLGPHQISSTIDGYRVTVRYFLPTRENSPIRC